MWTNSVFEALGCAVWPSPLAPLPKWERGDSGAWLGHLIAVNGYCEHLFCPPLNGEAEGQRPSDLRATRHRGGVSSSDE
jgi:hypothetical protein